VPRIKSAKKRMRQTKTLTAVNRGQRSQLRNAIRNVRQATDAEAKAQAFARAEKLISRAGQKRLIHPNTAARYKSRLSKIK
jgi:small subunit ribosomal protein S20